MFEKDISELLCRCNRRKYKKHTTICIMLPISTFCVILSYLYILLTNWHITWVLIIMD